MNIQTKDVKFGTFLATLFGPIGLLYSSVTGGLVLIALSFLIHSIIGIMIIWIISIITAIITCNNHNDNVKELRNLLTPKQGGMDMSVFSTKQK